MLTLPAALLPLLVAFAPLFSKPVWEHATVLLVGAILAPGKRTVTACLRVMGQSEEKHFQNYHRVMNRAQWSALKASQLLLRLLLAVFAPEGEVVVGLDDTIERRRGGQIRATGIYRDPVRSSRSHFVKASGLRWLSGMLLSTIPWARSVWGLPFLTVLCPSERYYTKSGRAPQTLTDRAWQMVQVIARWLPDRAVIFVADSSFAVLDLLSLIRGIPQVSVMTRLRLAAQLWAPAPARKPRQNGRPRLTGARRPSPHQVLADPKTQWTTLEIEHWYGGEKRAVEVYSETALWYKTGHAPVAIRWVLIRDPLGAFDPQALLSTTLEHTPLQILTFFVRRWRMEVTFQASRAYLGIETQRQWNARAIARTTPALFGLFSLVTLLATELRKEHTQYVRTAAWYAKEQPPFADALALVRRCLWGRCHFQTSPRKSDVVKIPRALFVRLTDAVCYAA
jgi:hypothetical protein